MVNVSRNPFARETLTRRNVYTNETCSWCGNSRRNKTGKQYLYAFTTETDGGRTFQHSGLFCSKSCHDSYLGT